MFGKVFYWFDKNRYETDIIMSCKSKAVPIEVKYRERESFDARDLKGLIGFCKKFDNNHAFVVTRSMLDEKNIDDIRVTFIPLWLFLLAF